MINDKDKETLDELAPDGADDVFDLLKGRLSLVDPNDFGFMKLSRRMCLIQRDDAGEDTGFLVGPDLMLTAAHALMGTSGIFADPDKVTILFDRFKWNTQKLAFGDQCKLRRIPFTNQPDVLASSIKVDPKSRQRYRDKDNDLDYILVRLDRPMGLTFLPYSHRIRGWNNCSRAAVPAEGDVIVVQHALGGLLRVAKGQIPKDHSLPDGSHLFRYETTTLNGASGAPIMDLGRRVVGIHLGEKSETEQFGVSFQKIFKDLRKEGVHLPPFRLSKKVMDSIFGTSAIEKKRRRRGKDWRGDRLFDDITSSKPEAIRGKGRGPEPPTTSTRRVPGTKVRARR
jgi:hypothetical protein